MPKTVWSPPGSGQMAQLKQGNTAVLCLLSCQAALWAACSSAPTQHKNLPRFRRELLAFHFGGNSRGLPPFYPHKTRVQTQCCQCPQAHAGLSVPAAYNARSPAHRRQAYRRRLARLTEHCELIPYLGRAMPREYTEPQHRPLGFDLKLQTFLSLKDAGPSFVQFGLLWFFSGY